MVEKELTYFEKVKECIEAADNAIDANDVLYTDWEINFLEDISKKVDALLSLTDKQMHKLVELYQKACKSNY